MNKLELIKNIMLEHRGKANKITSREISFIIGISEDDTHATTRKLILESATQYNLPLVADSGGYYLISDEIEYDKYMNNLDKRISGIEERKKIITKNFKEQNE